MTREEQVTLRELFHRLYGENGFEGSLPRIETNLKDLNGSVLKNTIRSVQNGKDIERLVWAISGILLVVIALIGIIVIV